MAPGTFMGGLVSLVVAAFFAFGGEFGELVWLVSNMFQKTLLDGGFRRPCLTPLNSSCMRRVSRRGPVRWFLASI